MLHICYLYWFSILSIFLKCIAYFPLWSNIFFRTSFYRIRKNTHFYPIFTTGAVYLSTYVFSGESLSTLEKNLFCLQYDMFIELKPTRLECFSIFLKSVYNYHHHSIMLLPGYDCILCYHIFKKRIWSHLLFHLFFENYKKRHSFLYSIIFPFSLVTLPCTFFSLSRNKTHKLTIVLHMTSQRSLEIGHTTH